jgi:putative transposase
MLIGIKRKLKLNNFEVTRFRKCSGYERFVWNYIYDMMLGVKDDLTSCSQKLDAIKKIFTNHVKNSKEYSWIESKS